jgi:hypothetical protein
MLKLGVQGPARKRDSFADVIHACGVVDEALEAEPEASVRHLWQLLG